jgi:hypothetical protein
MRDQHREVIPAIDRAGQRVVAEVVKVLEIEPSARGPSPETD